MRNKKRWLLLCLLLTAALSGCGGRKAAYLERIEDSAADAAGEAASENEVCGKADLAREQETPECAENREQKTPETADGADRAESGGAGDVCYVYVCGAVKTPGVYTLSASGRIYEAVALAGGLSEDAAADAVNQAEEICDGMMIRIPTAEEAASGSVTEPVRTDAAPGGDAVSESGGGAAPDGRLDLNTAEVSELMTLPGIGQAKAESIVAYRTRNGGFSSAEDIMKVEGIKEGVYNRIKDNIKVN